MPKIKLNFEILKTEEEKNKVIGILKAGMQSAFWVYLKQVLEYNIKAIENKILFEANMSDIDNKTYKLYLQSLKELKKSPEKHIYFLETGEEKGEEDPDPYYKSSDLNKSG